MPNKGPAPSKVPVALMQAAPDALSLLPEVIFDGLTPGMQAYLAWYSIWEDDRKACAYADVAPRTSANWRQREPRFQQALAIIGKNKIEFVSSLVKSLMVKAAARLDQLLDSDEEAIKLSAVKFVLSTGLKSGDAAPPPAMSITFNDIKNIRLSPEFAKVRRIIDGEFEEMPSSASNDGRDDRS